MPQQNKTPNLLDSALVVLCYPGVKRPEIELVYNTLTHEYSSKPEDIPLLVRDKVLFITHLAKLLLKRDISLQKALDVLNENESYKGFVEHCQHSIEEWVENYNINELLQSISERFDSLFIRKKINELTDLQLALEDETQLTPKYELIEKAKLTIKQTYQQIRKTEVITDEDEKPIIIGRDVSISDFLTKKPLPISTGYPLLDHELGGGFQTTYFYLLAGSSNIGKTNFLLNFYLNSLFNYSHDEKGFHLYVDFENTTEMMLSRFCCCHFDIPLFELKQIEIEGGKNLALYMYKTLKEKAPNILPMYKSYYRPATTAELESLILELEDQLEAKAKLIFIDYADLMNSLQPNLDYRFQLEEITLDLISIAKRLDVGIITVTQVNREGYDTVPKLTNVAESIKKVEHAPLVMTLGPALNPDSVSEVESRSGERFSHENTRALYIAKNRHWGQAGKTIVFETNFSHYKVVRDLTTSLSTATSYIEQEILKFNGIQQEVKTFGEFAELPGSNAESRKDVVDQINNSIDNWLE